MALHIATTSSALEALVRASRMKGAKGFDTEYVTFPLPKTSKSSKRKDDHLAASLVGWSFALEDDAWYVPVWHLKGPNADRRHARNALAAVLHGHLGGLWAHNWRADLHTLANEGMDLVDVDKCADSMLAAWLGGADTLALKSLVATPRPGFEEKFGGRSAALVDSRDMAEYAAMDAVETIEVGERHLAGLTDRQLNSLWDLEMPTAWSIFRMERRGLPCDVGILAKAQERAGAIVKEMEAEWEFFMPGVAISSSKQVGDALFGDGIWPREVSARTKKTGRWQVTSDIMEAARDALPEKSVGRRLAEIRIAWAEAAKIHSTYCGSLITLADHWGGRLHSQYTQTFARTGRFSSSAPNLQNLPSRGELARMVRAAIRLPDGWVFVSRDYSQLEPHVTAHLAGPCKFREMIERGDDRHQFVADAMGVDRTLGKRLNLALQYGGTPWRIEKLVGCSEQRAAELFNGYWDALPDVHRMREAMISAAFRRGWIQTLSGRRRKVEGTSARDARVAANTPIQGGAADVVKAAANIAEDAGLEVLCQVHDELIIASPVAEAEERSDRLGRCMAEAGEFFDLEVTLKSDARIGQSLAELMK